MTYMIVIQDNKVMGTCFADLQFWLHEGAMSIGWITSQGRMKEIHHGEFVGGHFKVHDND